MPASGRRCPPTISPPGASVRGESGFAWSFLGAALQATELPFGVVNAPGQRYHPAIVAHWQPGDQGEDVFARARVALESTPAVT
jgi:hypothetical protein